MEAPGSTPGPGRAAAAAAEEHKPFHARAGGGLAAAEQDRPHVRGRGRRGHARGVLRRGAPLSALLPGRGRRCPLGSVMLQGISEIISAQRGNKVGKMTCPRSPMKLVKKLQVELKPHGNYSNMVIVFRPHYRAKFLDLGATPHPKGPQPILWYPLT